MDQPNHARRVGQHLPMGLVTTLAAFVALATSAIAPADAAPRPVNIDDPTDRVEGNNPTLAQKLLGYDARVRATGRRPDVLILGSSRSIMLDPQQVHRVTGRTAYNAGISSGAARELLAVTSFADLRSAGDLPELVIQLDPEGFDNRQPMVRTLDYLRRLDAAHEACGDPNRCRRSMLIAARRLVADAAARQRTASRPYTETQRADGRQINGLLERLDAEGVDFDALRRQRIAIRIRSYRAPGFDKLYPAPREAFRRLLELANSRGVQPTIALSPMHPECIRRCGPAGWSARRREVRAMLEELQREYDFRWIDLSLPQAFGGSAASFYDEEHLRPRAAAQVVRRLARFGAFPHRTATRPRPGPR